MSGREAGAHSPTFLYKIGFGGHMSNSWRLILPCLVGYLWQQLQMLYRWFQLYLRYLDTNVDDVLTLIQHNLSNI